MLSSTNFYIYEKCAKCKFLSATLGDANFIREQVIQEYKESNIILSIEEINCLGFGSEICATKYCLLEGEAVVIGTQNEGDITDGL